MIGVVDPENTNIGRVVELIKFLQPGERYIYDGIPFNARTDSKGAWIIAAPDLWARWKDGTSGLCRLSGSRAEHLLPLDPDQDIIENESREMRLDRLRQHFGKRPANQYP